MNKSSDRLDSEPELLVAVAARLDKRWRRAAEAVVRFWFASRMLLRAVRRSFGPVAQLAEQQTLNLRVVGSIPTRLTT